MLSPRGGEERGVLSGVRRHLGSVWNSQGHLRVIDAQLIFQAGHAVVTPNPFCRSHSVLRQTWLCGQGRHDLLSQTRKWDGGGSLHGRAAKWGSLELSVAHQIVLGLPTHPLAGSSLRLAVGSGHPPEAA